MAVKWPVVELPYRVDVSSEVSSPTFGRFVIEPFEQGMAVVIGNALRRVLLSSLEGTAVTSVRIKGVLHEFCCVRGVLQDVSDIVLNVKRLRVKLHNDSPTTLRIVRNTRGDVHARDFQGDANAEIVNQDLVICTLTEDAELELEAVVRKGRGFVRAEENVFEGQDLGVIPVDSNFSPVGKVKYSVNPLTASRSGRDLEQLVLEVWTDGTLSPELAIVEAGKILRKHLMPFAEYSAPDEDDDENEQGAPAAEGVSDAQAGSLLDKSVSSLGLSTRALNSLVAEKIETIRDLVSRTEEQLLQIKNFGSTSLAEVTRRLSEMGLSLGAMA